MHWWTTPSRTPDYRTLTYGRTPLRKPLRVTARCWNKNESLASTLSMSDMEYGLQRVVSSVCVIISVESRIFYKLLTKSSFVKSNVSLGRKERKGEGEKEGRARREGREKTERGERGNRRERKEKREGIGERGWRRKRGGREEGGKKEGGVGREGDGKRMGERGKE